MGTHRAHRHGVRSRRAAAGATPTVDVSPAVAGKRKAARHSASRGPLFRALPPAPVLAGVAALAVSVGGAVTGTDVLDSVSAQAASSFTGQPTALGGSSGAASANLLSGRGTVLSRDSSRDALADATPQEKVDPAVEQQAKQRDAALAAYAQRAEKQSDKIALNLWTLPVEGYNLTNTFGVARGYYSSGYHTGLDFNTGYGAPISAVANGVITSVGYDGAYGNKTVLTLDDGTEIWFCHQSSFAVSVGEEVRSGELIGYVGATGHAYGSHLHLEVHPGGGDAVDPFAAFVQHGITP